MPLPPPHWDRGRLDDDRQTATSHFREERMAESLRAYLQNFRHYREAVERLLSTTDDLTSLAASAAAVLSDSDLAYAVRYLAGPPISLDDLKTLAQARLSSAGMKADVTSARRAVDTILRGLDSERFSWVGEERRPSEDEREVAIVATATLIASQRVRTGRQTEAPRRQEELVKRCLREVDLVEVPRRRVPTVFDAPDIGHFMGESVVGNSRKADLVVRLWDGRMMPIECKVSNSELNSIKRLSNDAAVKANVWIADLGRVNVVPVAVLSGVFGLETLVEAQDRGLTLFWEHSLHELQAFVEGTRE